MVQEQEKINFLLPNVKFLLNLFKSIEQNFTITALKKNNKQITSK